MNVPDIGGLLGKITEKRESGELPRTDIQRVQPVESVDPGLAVEVQTRINNKAATSKAGKTPKQENAKTAVIEVRGVGGRPTAKMEGVEYVKISPRIPKPLKQASEIALVEERFKDKEGRAITTMDELVTLALARLIKP